MHRLRQGKVKFTTKVWKFINNSIFKLSLLTTFLGVLPLVLFIYYNLVYFNTEKALVGCVVLMCMIKANKSIQG